MLSISLLLTEKVVINHFQLSLDRFNFMLQHGQVTIMREFVVFEGLLELETEGDSFGGSIEFAKTHTDFAAEGKACLGLILYFYNSFCLSRFRVSDLSLRGVDYDFNHILRFACD